MEENDYETEQRFYADRTVGGDRDHRFIGVNMIEAKVRLLQTAEYGTVGLRS